MYVHALACTQLRCAERTQLMNGPNWAALNVCGWWVYSIALRWTYAVALIEFSWRDPAEYVHSSQRNWVRSMDSIVLTIWTALHLPSHIKFRHSKRVAIENLLFEKLLIFSPLLSSSKYIVGVMATAWLFVANVSKPKPSAHIIAMAEMVVHSA